MAHNIGSSACVPPQTGIYRSERTPYWKAERSFRVYLVDRSRTPLLYAGWPPSIPECFIRVLTIRWVDQRVLIPFLVHNAGECFGPVISAFIHILDEEIIVVMFTKPFHDFSRWCRAICVNAD